MSSPKPSPRSATVYHRGNKAARVGQAFSSLTAMEASALKEGDLIFGSRDSGAFQKIIDLVGAGWRHVGVVVIQDGDVMVLEAAHPKVRMRPIENFCAAYPRVGSIRLSLNQGCVAGATGWLRDQALSGSTFAWDDLVLAGILSLTRRGFPSSVLSLVESAVHAAASQVARQPVELLENSYTCSALVATAFSRVGAGCSLQVDVTAPVDVELYPKGVGTITPDLTLGELVEIHRSDPTRSQKYLNERPLYEILRIPPSGAVDVQQKMGQSSQVNARVAGASYLEVDQGRTPKGAADIWVSTLDVVSAAGTVLRGVAGAPDVDAPASELQLGRWVTPGDLWMSPTAIARYRIKD